jgi:hypothetical protein
VGIVRRFPTFAFAAGYDHTAEIWIERWCHPIANITAAEAGCGYLRHCREHLLEGRRSDRHVVGYEEDPFTVLLIPQEALQADVRARTETEVLRSIEDLHATGIEAVPESPFQFRAIRGSRSVVDHGDAYRHR